MICTLRSWRATGTALVLATTLLSPTQPPQNFDFAHDVLPILQRAGCSSAYCHGSATGRAGFRLSLFGSDPAADFEAITAQLGGRRVDLRDPDRSLILQKAIGKLTHGGGKRFAQGSSAHGRLREWIASGAPWRTTEPQQLCGLEAVIVDREVQVRATFQTSLRANETEQDVRDVRDVALFASDDPTVVTVDASGNLTFHGCGQAHVTARFGHLTAVARIVRPFAAVAQQPTIGQASTLDQAWQRHLNQLGLPTGTPIDAQLLARRLHLDLVARPPTPQELDQFVAMCDEPASRAAAIAACVTRLASRREFAEVWGAHLGEWFELSAADAAGPAAQAANRLRLELVQSLVQGDSLPTMVRRLVLGQRANGGAAPNMLDRFSDARDRAEFAGRTVLGKRIGCARCHDHPSDRWRQSEHLAFSACFAPPRADGAGGMSAGAMFDADTGEQVPARLLELSPAGNSADGGAQTGISANDTVATDLTRRREQVTEFLLADTHDSFAINACNRVFAIVLGRGLVEPVDDHRPSNPPIDADMLHALVQQFHACDGDLPELLTFVMSSAVYATPMAPTEDDQGRASAKHFASQPSRSLSPQTYHRAIEAVLGTQPKDSLPASALARELALQNGPMIRELLAAGGTTVDATFDLCTGPTQRLVELWRTILSRSPRKEELARFVTYADDRDAYRDLAFALLTGREFGHRR